MLRFDISRVPMRNNTSAIDQAAGAVAVLKMKLRSTERNVALPRSLTIDVLLKIIKTGCAKGLYAHLRVKEIIY